MRILLAILFSAFCSISCSTNELTREEAAQILKQGFPKPYEFELYMTVPEQAKLALDSDLDEKGYMTIQRLQKFEDIGKPFIYFTDKAKPYLLETSEEDVKKGIQRVKLADEEFGEITGLKINGDEKTAIVEYTTTLKNLTPFVELMPRKIKKTTATNKAKFSLYDDGWRLEKR